MEALHINNLVTIKASKRITEIVKSLNSFVQLESEFQNMDLREALENILNLFNHEISNKITVIKEYGDIPHGQIKTESEIGKGSTFTIILPKNII